jgi:hypothetical protein
VELFHRQEFWESHEVLEGPWREGGSRFYHGLILLASAWVHVQRNNLHGVRAQLRKAEAALEPFAPHYLGVDVAEILEEARRLGEAAAGSWSPPAAFPRIDLASVRVRGDEPELDQGRTRSGREGDGGQAGSGLERERDQAG